MATPQEIKAMNAAKTAASVVAGSNKSAKAQEPKAEETMDIKAMMEEMKRLRTENDEFKKRQRPVTFDINEKGAVAIYGVGRYAIQLYKVQWERILEHSEQLKAFIEENKHNLN